MLGEPSCLQGRGTARLNACTTSFGPHAQAGQVESGWAPSERSAGGTDPRGMLGHEDGRGESLHDGWGGHP